MQEPLITIGITSYNAIETIDRAINSALLQSWKNNEIIVVDDMSTDGSYEYISKYASKRQNIRVFQNARNSGVAISRNKIIAEARGEFIAFFDDDDESYQERLEQQYRRITDYESKFSAGAPVICHSARELTYPHGEIRVEKTLGEKENKSAPSGMRVVNRILLGEPLEDGYGACPTCSQMARTNTYRRLNGFDKELRRGEDTDFNIRLGKNAGHFVGISVPLVKQYMTNTSEKSVAEELKYMLLILSKHKEVFGSESNYAFACNWLEVKHCWLEGDRIAFMGRLINLLIRYPIKTTRRIVMAMPSIGVNRAFRQFHKSK